MGEKDFEVVMHTAFGLILNGSYVFAYGLRRR